MPQLHIKYIWEDRRKEMCGYSYWLSGRPRIVKVYGENLTKYGYSNLNKVSPSHRDMCPFKYYKAQAGEFPLSGQKSH